MSCYRVKFLWLGKHWAYYGPEHKEYSEALHARSKLKHEHPEIKAKVVYIEQTENDITND